MIVTYDIAWRVWYIKAFGQWVVHPPDGFYQRGEFTFLTNTQSLYFRRQADAWRTALKNARKLKTIAVLYTKDNKSCRTKVDYRSDKNEEVQATECPQHLYP
jgi:hypothetical protein